VKSPSVLFLCSSEIDFLVDYITEHFVFVGNLIGVMLQAVLSLDRGAGFLVT
jgi:hypothetical protein